MTQDEIEFLRKLDPKGLDGTIQSILLSPEDQIKSAPFDKVARKLIQQLFNEKWTLIREKMNPPKL